MAKFIQVHIDGYPMIVNLDHVQKIDSGYHGKAIITFNSMCSEGNEYYTADETYSEVLIMVGESQGGIPMGNRKENSSD